MMELFSFSNIQKDAHATWSLSAGKECQIGHLQPKATGQCSCESE
jgi:hypothetical protein